jgi:MoaA/NifB/PqqE/SkfB family radical SAM enzyme
MGFGRSLALGAEISRDLWIRQRPFLLYFTPTARCDLRCAICNRWGMGDKSEELSLQAIRELLAKFRRAGCVVLTLWGGEPMLRPDLGEILAAARAVGMKTSICTNANQLARQAERVLPHLDVLLCSLDGHGEVHDEMRGAKGLFERAVRGLELAARHPGCEVKIWASVHRRNLHQIAALAALARDLGIGIEFFPISPTGRDDSLLARPEELAEAFAEAQRLKHQGFPVRNPDRVLRIMQRSAPFRCNFGRIAIHVDQRGEVRSCEGPIGAKPHSWGHYTEFDPDTCYASPEYRAVAVELTRCDGCRLPCAVELSGSLPRALAGMFFKSLGQRRGRTRVRAERP